MAAEPQDGAGALRAMLQEAEAGGEPSATAGLVGQHVRRSLDGAWRAERVLEEGYLQALADLSLCHLARLRAESLTEAPEAGGADSAPASSEAAACAACFKLARNLCAGSKEVQEFWWQCGLVSKLDESLRADLAEPGEREATWREVSVGFLANSIAGHSGLRAKAREQLFPQGLAAACLAVKHKPELAFILTHNMFASGDALDPGGEKHAEIPRHLEQLACTPDGHAMIYLLLSLLSEASSAGNGAKAQEWASVFFHTLWSHGCFSKVYIGIKEIMTVRLYYLLCTSAGIRATDSEDSDRLTCMPRLAVGLCSHGDALGMLWHTIDGLLDGQGEGSDRAAQASGGAKQLANILLRDEQFELVVAEEMSETIIALAAEFSLELRFPDLSTEALASLGLSSASDIDVAQLAASALARRKEELEAEEWRQLRAEKAEADGHSEAVDCFPAQKPKPAVLFRDIMTALIQLTAVSSAAGSRVPPRLVGVLLSGNLAFLDALHRLRFGEKPLPRKTSPPPEVVEASRTCLLVENIRLCGNVLYDNHSAQEFLRLSHGLRVLLCNAYADHDLPLLREAGIFALRNATKNNLENQEAVRTMLLDRTVQAPAPGTAPQAEELDMGLLQ